MATTTTLSTTTSSSSSLSLSSHEPDPDPEVASSSASSSASNSSLGQTTTTTTKMVTTKGDDRMDVGFCNGLFRMPDLTANVRSSMALRRRARTVSGSGLKSENLASEMLANRSPGSPSKRSVVVPPLRALTPPPRAALSSSSSFSEDRVASSEGEEVMEETNNCFFVRSSVLFLREQDAAYAGARGSNKWKPPLSNRSGRIMSSRSKPDLDAIPESAILNKPFDERPVVIISMVNGHSEGSNRCPEEVARSLHGRIASHLNFTNMQNIPSVLRDAFKATDEEFLKLVANSEEDSNSGCSVITLVIAGNDVCVGHIGRSRALIMGNNGKPMQVTADHNPIVDEERIRIESAGCQVSGGKINGSLCFSRSIGDAGFKKKFLDALTNLPDTCHFRVTPPKRRLSVVLAPNRTGYIARARSMLGLGKGESYPALAQTSEPPLFMILGSSAVWDVLSNAEACKLIDKYIRKHNSEPNAAISEKASQYLVRKVAKLLKKNGTSRKVANVSVCIIRWIEVQEEEVRNNEQSTASSTDL